MLGFRIQAAEPDEASDEAALFVELADDAAVRGAFSGPVTPAATATASLDGAQWVVESGVAGDLRIQYGDRAAFHLDAAATRLLCAPASRDDPRWQRALLDTGLVTASLQRGNDALHAGAVVIGGKAVAIAGPSGAGKSTLLSTLVARGHPLLTDDILVVTDDGGDLLAHPGPELMNLPEAAASAGREILADFGEEVWARVAPAADGPVPLSAIYVLDRAKGARDQIVTVTDTAPVLLGLGLDSGSAPERRMRRLGLLSSIAARVPVRRLVAGLGTHPETLADMIEC